MTQATENDHPRVVSTINEAIDFAANDQTSVAVQLLTTLAEEFPRTSSVHGYLAWFLLQIGRHQAAIGHSQEAVSLSPRSERASLIHFHVLWEAGQRIQALDEMKRFLMIRPSEEYASIIKDWEPGRK
jgi:tetratricopeptide (TPR) repeat protein